LPHHGRTLKIVCNASIGKIKLSLFIAEVMRIRIFHRLTIYMYPKMVFWGVEGKDVKILCFNPQKALSCVNTRLLVHRMS